MRVLKEIFKTIIWFPWAILELLSGNLPPSTERLLRLGVGGTIIILVEIILLTIYTAEIMPDVSTFPYTFAAALCAPAYLVMGALIRYVGSQNFVLR